MQLYTENKKKTKLQFYYQLLALTRNNIALYKSCVGLPFPERVRVVVSE